MITTAETLQKAENLLQPWTISVSRPEENRLDVVMDVDHLLEASQIIITSIKGAYLAAITGLDRPGADGAEGKIENLYSFILGAAIITLRISVPYSNAVLPSLCGLIPSATLYEREMIEMFGVNIADTPDTNRLLLPDDWPDGVYPLRKSFSGLDEDRTELK